MQALSPMPGTANAINNDGQIVGEVTYPVSPALFSPQAFLYAGGQMQYLPQGGSYSVAYAISADSNCIAGISTGSAGLADTFLYTGGQMHDLGMAPGGAVQPISVTDSGEVVGNTYASYGPTSSQAFVYRDGAFQSLAASGSTWTCACSANASGEIVGVSDAFIGTSNPAGVCFYANGSWTSLASLIDPQDGVTVAAAGAVNDAGQIAFIGDGPDGLEHAYLLSPTPEPATLSLLALGGLAAMKRRRA
jgi:probable HAF family extracellular repeat protein